jgi:hypothetical protein
MSFEECTAKSRSPEISPSSSSWVNRPLPPSSVSARSVMRSPVVDSTTISNMSSGRPCAVISRARVSEACASASGLPRVPIRKGFVCIRVIPLLPEAFVDRFIRHRNYR